MTNIDVRFSKYPVLSGIPPFKLLNGRWRLKTAVSSTLQVTPNQRFSQGSPVNQFVAVNQIEPEVDWYKSTRAFFSTVETAARTKFTCTSKNKTAATLLCRILD